MAAGCLDGERFVEPEGAHPFTCGICLSVPHSVVFCTNDHAFCVLCIAAALERKKECPTCKAVVRSMRKMRRMTRIEKQMYEALRVYCVHRERGCGEVVRLVELSTHQTACGKQPSGCQHEGCGWEGWLEARCYHEAGCEYRKLRCIDCSEEVPHCGMQVHLRDSCVKRLVECLECRVMVQFDTVEVHLINECVEVEVKCTVFGCTSQCRRRDLPQHMEDAMVDHLSIMSLHLNQVKELRNNMEVLKEENRCLVQANEALKKDNMYLKGLILPPGQWSYLEDEDITFTIGGVFHRIHEPVGTMMISTPWYTKHNGYKFELHMYFNGKTEEHEGHLSVFLRVIRGEHDGELTWPFRQKATFTLGPEESWTMDPSINEEDEEAFDEWPDEESTSWGWPQFVAQDRLETLCSPAGVMKLLLRFEDC